MADEMPEKIWATDGLTYFKFEGEPNVTEYIRTDLAQQAWRPISEAPKDGTIFLGYYCGGNWSVGHNEVGKHNCVVIWHSPETLVNELNPFRWESFGPSSYHEHSISHWKPLDIPKDVA